MSGCEGCDTGRVSMPPPPPPNPSGPWGQQPPSGQYQQGYSPYAGYGLPQVEHPNGTTILVLGILSLLACGILGPFAWKMSNDALREMNANPGVNYVNRGNVTAGRICGIISSVLLIIGVAGILLVIIFGAAFSING